MESSRIVQFLHAKTILVTGVTGFLGKIFIEKILRIQRHVKKLYLLVRAADSKIATQRLLYEVIEKDVFKVAKSKWDENLNSFIAEKVIAVPGDVSSEHLGVEEIKVREEMWREIDIIVNMAASTKFDERYDVALGINTLGAFNVLSFAKKCINLKTLLHVSTAYVCGEKEGLVLEKPLDVGDALNKTHKLDINAENMVMKNKLNELQLQGATEEGIKKAMMDLGIERARLYGWPNTYVFTKAMGEMLLGQFKDDMALVIVRPTMVLSTYKEPFPGWIEGLRTMDSVIISYGKGKVTGLLGNHDTILDVIPADMVGNAMMVAMVAHASQPSVNIIYHVGSSLRNHLKLGTCHDCAHRYFIHNPLTNGRGNPIKIKRATLFGDMSEFRKYLATRYMLPLKGLRLVNEMFCNMYKDVYVDLDRKIKLMMRFVELYKPYLLFKGTFDDTNTEKLRIAARESGSVDMDIFNFDPKTIDWEDYLINTHFPGLVKHVVKRNATK